jgi:hypothetical protein
MQTEFNILSNKISQAKYLPLLSQILRNINDNTVSIKLLEQKLQKWSIEKKQTSEFYRNHNGILTHKTSDLPTSAFRFYIDFLQELKLITKLNDFVRCTKYGLVFIALHNELQTNDEFPEFEKLFYLLLLFSYDTDSLLLILDYLAEQNQPVPQIELARKYKDLIKIRLEHRLHQSENSEIRNKYLSLIRPQTEKKTVSKRIIPPRLEWLTDLGLIKDEKKDFLVLTEKGKSFYSKIPKHDLTISKISVVNNDWFYNDSITSFSKLLNRKILFSSIEPKEQIILLQKYLQMSYDKLNTDSVSRLSTLPAFIFLSIMLLLKENLILNFSEIKNILLNGLETENKIYSLRDANRINESYILINIK